MYVRHRQIEGSAGPHLGWKDHPGLIEKSASGPMMWLLIGVCVWSEEWQFTRRQPLGVCNAVEDRYQGNPSCFSFWVTPSPALKGNYEFRNLSEPQELPWCKWSAGALALENCNLARHLFSEFLCGLGHSLYGAATECRCFRDPWKEKPWLLILNT